MNYTDEQLAIVDEIQNHNTNKIIAVNAIAGSGKTKTCELIVNTVKPKKGFYTAFNRAIVEDGVNKFGKLIPCKTIHALAYQYANSKKKKIEELTYRDIDLVDTIKEKTYIIEIMEDFFLSRYLDFYEYTKAHHIELLKNEILYYMDKMLNEEMSPTFSFLLKKFHMMLAYGDVRPHFDLFICDESQDLNGVMLEILKYIDADHKVILGDKFQNIYSFMNTVNAFEELNHNEMIQFRLTNSFRCESEIGSRVEYYGDKALETGYIFKGVMPHSDEIQTKAYLTKLNASLIKRMHYEIESGNTFSLIRDINAIFELPLAMENASKGREVFSKRYKYLQEIRDNNGLAGAEFLMYLTDDTKFDDQTVYIAKLLLEFEQKHINLYKLREAIRMMEPNRNYILSSIHAFKGLEADDIFLDNDISFACNAILEKNKEKSTEQMRSLLDAKDKETLNLMYVGMSRAKHSLRNGYY